VSEARLEVPSEVRGVGVVAVTVVEGKVQPVYGVAEAVVEKNRLHSLPSAHHHHPRLR